MIYCGDGTATQGSKGWTTYSTTKTLTTPVIAWANGDDGYIPPKESKHFQLLTQVHMNQFPV